MCFETNVGLRQECIFCPLVFSLFLNDLVDYFMGRNFLSKRANILLHVYDIVLVAPSITVLQQMIKRL